MFIKKIQKLRSIFDGYLVGSQFDWKNRICSKDMGIRLIDAKGLKYIHVGHHRTGSLFLQEEVFPKYQASKKIFSDDTLCGKLFENGLNAVEYIYKNHPKVKILIIIRSQPSIINSSYRTYIKAGGVWNFKRFTKEILLRKKYDFFPLISKYVHFFSKKNCKIMIFEDLIKSPTDFVKAIVKFIGEKKILKHDYGIKSPGPSNLFNELFRYVNIFTKILSLSGVDGLYVNCFGDGKNVPSVRFRKFCYRWGISIDKKIFKKLRITGKYQYGYKSVLTEINATYALNNKKLSKLIGKDLSSYKYPIN